MVVVCDTNRAATRAATIEKVSGGADGEVSVLIDLPLHAGDGERGGLHGTDFNRDAVVALLQGRVSTAVINDGVVLEIGVGADIVISRRDGELGLVDRITVVLRADGIAGDFQLGQGFFTRLREGLGEDIVAVGLFGGRISRAAIHGEGDTVGELIAGIGLDRDLGLVDGAGGKVAGNRAFTVKPLDISSQTGGCHGHAGVRCSALNRSIQTSDGHAGDGCLGDGDGFGRWGGNIGNWLSIVSTINIAQVEKVYAKLCRATGAV